jgi:hypothetical protein
MFFTGPRKRARCSRASRGNGGIGSRVQVDDE